MSEPDNKIPKSNLDQNGKDEQLNDDREDSSDEYLTTNQGLRLENTDDSLKAGPRGPTLMEDFHFREKITHFDHERIPERVVHARGAGAHGYFEVYESMADLTMAGFLQDPSIKTPVFVRFSTVVGSRGSADTVRDARGFATKFYTNEGNFDLVGNNIPVFFIQDGIKFPDLVHSIKPEPHNEIPQATAAHDTFWDFISLTTESANMIMWVLSDRAIPRSFRMMEGFGVHTFRFVNAQGVACFVKFHWRPTLGIASLVWDEAQKLGGADPDWLRRDLWEAIDMGQFPEYELGVQIVEEKDEHNFDFDLLDATKIIPEAEVPVRIIGKMTLNRNPDNFFAETEQVAFHPGHVVSGIDFTNDPLLQGRLFSYTDTQLLRLGGSNFAEIPINRPVAPVHNNQRDGFMRQTINKGRGSYSPNSIARGCPMSAPQNMGGYVHHMEKVDGRKVRERSESFKDHFSQATMFWNGLTDTEKDHLVSAAHFELGKVEVMEVRQRMVHDFFDRIDNTLARRVAEGIGVKPPAATGANPITKATPDGSVERRTRKDTVETRRVAILAADGFDEKGLTAAREALEKAGAGAKVVAMHQGMLKGANGGTLKVDKSYVTTASVTYDAVLVPGGRACVDTLKTHGKALHFIAESFKHGKAIGAIGEGAELLQAAGLGAGAGSPGQKAPAGVVSGAAEGFGARFIQAVAQHRHWDRETKDSIPG